MEEALDTIVPDDPQKPYDMRSVIVLIVDDGDFFEVHEHFAKNIVCVDAAIAGACLHSRFVDIERHRSCRGDASRKVGLPERRL